MSKVLWIIGLSLISAVLYRLGGKGKPFNTKFRDLGCPLIALIALWLLDGFKLSYWWAYLLTFGFTFGALTTYWDWLFGQDNFYAHGFGIGLAYLPLFWSGIPLWPILVRSFILALFMGLWSKFWGWDDMEEGGRGAGIVLTLPIFLL